MQPLLKRALILLLGFWFGASAHFTVVTAPTVFELGRAGLLSSEQTGEVAAALLRRYFLCGVLVLTLALLCGGLLAFGTGRPKFRRCAALVALTLALATADWLVVAPRVSQLRQQRRIEPTVELNRQFRLLHSGSLALNLLVIAGTAWAFAVAVRPD